MSDIGYVAEGRVLKQNGEWFIITDDHVVVRLADVWEKWDGKRVRMLLANLDILDKVAELGCLPGQEGEFIANLPTEQLENL